MCSDRKNHRPLVVLLPLAAVLLVGLAACGKKGDPLPPLRNVPLATGDLTLRQQGDMLFFELGYPATTASGLALGGVDAVELYELVKPATTDGGLPILDGREFESAAQSITTLRGSELTAAVTGDRIQLRLPMADPLPDPPTASFFAVRTLKGDESSDFSNRVGLVPAEPPSAPTGLELDAKPVSVELRWQYEDEAAEGFEIYRRDARQRGYPAAIERVPGSERSFKDQGARYGNRYIYTVRAIKTTEPLVLSAEAGEREIEYEDVFPPPLPRNFVALAEAGSVRLRWDASNADDVAGYILYRSEPGRDFHPITEQLIQDLEYVSRGLTTGFTYSFKIQAVDKVGNESPVSNAVTTTLR